MLALGIALSFLIIGALVVFIALSGGPKGARKNMQSNSRRSTRTTGVVAGVATAVFGLAIPAVILVVQGSTGAEQAGPVELSDREVHGRELFAENCATCHALDASNAVGRVGPDLDELRPPVELTLDAIEQGRARGMGQMPARLLTGEDALAVAEYVAAVAGRPGID